MLRAIAIGIAVLVVVVFAAIAIGYYRVNQQFGISESPQVGYEELVTPSTRGIVLLQTEKALPFLREMLPAKVRDVPDWIPLAPAEILDRAAFREAAILVGSDRQAGQINLTLFVNEKRGGPALVTEGNRRWKEMLPPANPLKWNDPPLELPKRGVVKAVASLPMTPAVVQAVQTSWPDAQQNVELPVTREHMVEIYIDNTQGDLASIIAAGMDSGQPGSGSDVLNHPMVGQTLTAIRKLRATADITGPDQVTVQIAITATPEKAKGFPLFFNMGVPVLQKEAEKAGLKVEFANGEKPKVEGDVITANLWVSGFRQKLEATIADTLGAPEVLPEASDSPTPAPAVPATTQPAS